MNTFLAAIVTYNPQAGTVTMAPSELVAPLVTVVLAVVGSASVLVIIWVGFGWLLRQLREVRDSIRGYTDEDMAEADYQWERSQQIEREWRDKS